MGRIEMINVVLIDDDEFEISELEFLLSKYDTCQIVGKFTDPDIVHEQLEIIKPDVAFLDINMPRTSGIDLAIKLLKNNIQIVFTTAYADYAVEAFELYAIDYVLKPVSDKRLSITMQRIFDRIKDYKNIEEENPKVIIKTFGQFSVKIEGKTPIKWRTEKVKELFAFLLQNANCEVPKDIILENVFLDRDVENSTHQLHNGIYYIKKTLQEYGINKKYIDIQGKYTLKLADVDYDRMTIKKILDSRERQTKDLEIIVETYADDYLKGFDGVWVMSERDYLQNIFINMALRLADEYIKENRIFDAETVLLKVYDKDPYIDKVTLMLIEIFKKQDRKNRAFKHYKDYEKRLQEDLGVRPEEIIRKLIKGIR